MQSSHTFTVDSAVSACPPAHHTDEGGAPGEPDSHRVCLPSLGGASLSARASTRVRRLRRTLSAGENAVWEFRSFRWLSPLRRCCIKCQGYRFPTVADPAPPARRHPRRSASLRSGAPPGHLPHRQRQRATIRARQARNRSVLTSPTRNRPDPPTEVSGGPVFSGVSPLEG